MSLLNTILNIIFPVNCVSCGEEGEDLCLSCLHNSPEAERESEKWVFPLYDYRHQPIKKSIWLLKYKGKKRLARVFGSVMYARILEELDDLVTFHNFIQPILVPIPLSNARMKERGFNQTELICREIIKLDKNTNLTLDKDTLVKVKETTRQAHVKERKDRLQNLVGSFGVVTPANVKGRNIILLDDVTTTGATLKEAKHALKKAGAKKIVAFTLAH